MSTLIVENLKGPTTGSNANKITIPSGQTLSAAGHVIQVKQTVVGGVFSSSIGNGFVEMTDFRTAITPSSTSSKILATATLHVGTSYFQIRGRLLRDTTPIGLGDARGNRTVCTYQNIIYPATNANYMINTTGFEFLDSPATTSSVTYSIDIGGYDTSEAVYLNRANQDNNFATYNGQPMSTLTVMEIAG